MLTFKVYQIHIRILSKVEVYSVKGTHIGHWIPHHLVNYVSELLPGKTQCTHTHTHLLNPEREAKTLGNCTLLELPKAYELGDAYRSRDDSKHLHYGEVHSNMGGNAEAAITELCTIFKQVKSKSVL